MLSPVNETVEPIRLAIAGCGGSRRSFGPVLRDCADLRMAAYVDPDPVSSRVWNRYLAKAPSFCDVSDMLRNAEVDAVLLTSPAPARAAEALELARAGKHVLCEVPFAGSLPDYDRLAEVAQANGVLVMPVLPRRHHAVFHWAKSAVETGAIGTPQQLRAEWRFYAGWAKRRARLRRWRELFMELAAHTLDLGAWFLGPPISVSADLDLEAGSTRGRQMGNIIVHHALGPSIHHIARTDRMEALEQYHLTGSKGGIEISYGPGWSYDDMTGYTAAMDRGSDRGEAGSGVPEEYLQPPPGPHASPYAAMLRHFADCIRTGGAPSPNLSDARLIAEQLVAAALSCIEGAKVSLPVVESTQVTATLRGAGWIQPDTQG